MKESEKRMLAACGLICTDCDIYKIPFDDEVADHMVKWFKAEGWLEETAGVSDVIAKGMYCKGCHGDRALHWDAECWILVCCVDERGLDNCSQCDVFPCERLAEWAAGLMKTQKYLGGNKHPFDEMMEKVIDDVTKDWPIRKALERK